MTTTGWEGEDPECTALRNSTFNIEKQKPHPSTRAEGVAFQVVQFYLENALLVAFLLTFAFIKFVHPERRSFHRLRIRKFYFLIITHFGASMASVSGSWNDIQALPWTMPCWVLLSFTLMIPACMVVPQFTQLLSFYRAEQLTNTVIKRQKRYASTLSVASGVDKAPESTLSSEDESSGLSWCNMIVAVLGLRRSLGVFKTNGSVTNNNEMTNQLISNRKSPGSTLSQGDISPTIGKSKRITPVGNDLNEIKMLNFLRSRTAEVVVLALIFVPFFIAVAVILGTTPMVGLGCWGCMSTTATNVTSIVLSVVIIIMLIAMYRTNLQKSDPFGIINEIRMIVWLGGLPAVLCLILFAVINDSRGNFKVDMLIEIFLTVICFIQSPLQCILAARDRRKEKEALLKYDLSLQEFEDKVLRTKGPFHAAFGDHLASEHAYESLAFLKDVMQWEHTFYDVVAKSNRIRAKKLLNMYVGNDAALPCNLPDAIVRRLHDQIAGEEDLPADYFKPAKEDIINMLYHDSFTRFIRTNVFRVLCEELQTQQGQGVV